ncbi:hypothetical protein DHEL01_v212216 [Diaporthe helianthi]|uniref:Helicase C-terminal domain-containing protein n=1 Tax=Diaporthe helianthi TaxID=158607 RepID=A0A2P5HGM4_DIAHE|nr:hypothetical protein DHEL01_v212216 [Diaporthe helianthi]
MSSADQGSKRVASAEPEEAEPNKRLKQGDPENESHGEVSQTRKSATKTVAAAHGEGTQAEAAPLEQVGIQKNNDVATQASQLQGSGARESIGDGEEEPKTGSDTDSSSGNELNVPEEAREKSKEGRRKWMKVLDNIIQKGNHTGFLSKELREKGHNSRPSMSSDERRRLLEDLDEKSSTPETHGQDIKGSCVQPRVGLDFMGECPTPVDSPKDDAAFLGIDLQSLNISPESALRLRLDQVQNIAFMVKKAEGILSGCVNANAPGTGKNVEALASIFFLAQRRQANSELGTHKAAFILCPSQALQGWQEIHAKYFSGLLTLHICSKSLPQGEHSQLIDPPSASALAEFLDTLSPSDPQTSRTVVICTYGELSCAEFLARRNKEDCREKELALRGSKLTEEAVEALEVAQKPILFDLNFNPAIIGTLIADEAHQIKHPRSKKAQAAYLLDADIHFLLTAYPVDNKISDFRGLLFALYKSKEWQIRWPRDKEFEAILKMFDDDFDPFKVQDSMDSMSSVPKAASEEYLQALRNGQHLWRLNPHAYRWLGHKMKFGPEFSRRVLSSIFRLCLLRRGVVSVTTLPSAGSNTISGILALPPLSISTIEVSRGREEQRYEQLAGLAFNWIFQGDEKNKSDSAARVITDNETPLAALDNFWVTYLGHITADLGLVDVRRTFESKRSRDSVLPGIDALIRNNTDAGMSFYYRMTRRDSDPDQPPADRSSMIRYLVRQSPKLRWLLVRLDELKQRGEKVVIYCVHPLTQWLVEGVCCMAEFDVLSLRSKPKHSDETRFAVIDEFNDPTKRRDLLPSTFRILGHSVDLHADCHNMIFFELPHNMTEMLSAIGRIRRVGQTEPQEVSILTMKDSYDDYTLHSQFKKYATAMLAFSVLGEPLDILAWHVDGLVERDRLEYLGRQPEDIQKVIQGRLERNISALEAVKLLAAGELLRQHLGARYNRSCIPWRCRHNFIFRPHGWFGRMQLTDFSGAEMDANTEMGSEVIHQAAQLPPIGPPTAEVEELSECFLD